MSFLQPQVKGSIAVGSTVGAAASVASLPAGADGTVLTADSAQASGLKYATPPGVDVGVSVGKSVNQTTTSGGVPTLTWDTEDWDTNGFHDNAVNNDRLTVPVGYAGKYLVVVNVQFDTNATGARLVAVQKNGSGTGVRIVDTRDALSGSGFGTSVSISGYINLAVGDFLTVVVFQNSGGNLDIVGSGSMFQMQKVG